MRHLQWILVVGLLLGLPACTTFRGISAVYPEIVGHPQLSPAIVDSLQPILRWKASPEQDASYDLIIYEGIKTWSLSRGYERAVGKEVYYRERFKETEHKIEEALKPSSEYYWSVRVRRGEQVSAWSVYNYELFVGVVWVSTRNSLFRFQTPVN